MRTNYIKCGDCIKLIKELPTNSIDVVFTSPPYNRIRNDVYENYDDNIINYLALLISITNESLRVVKDKVIINIQQNYFNKKEFFTYLGLYSDNISGVVIWNKTNPRPSVNIDKKKNMRSVTNAFEYFIFLTKSGKEFKHYGTYHLKNVLTTSINSYHVDSHSAIMKKEVCEWFLKHFTKKGDIILDPFCGTGTTGVVCVQHNRKFIGYEISKEYCKIAVERIRNEKLYIVKRSMKIPCYNCDFNCDLEDRKQCNEYKKFKGV